jgi:hypothetical protein
MNIMENPRNFWPELGAQKMDVPKALMVEQANFFNEMTKNVLVAKVRTRTAFEGTISLFYHEFDISVPSLGNYTFTLFTVKHGIDLFPVEIYFDLNGDNMGEFEASEFDAALKSILTNKRTVDAINGLLAQI